MNHEWFHRTSGMFGNVDEVGPISESEILALAMEGKLKRDSLVRSPTRTNNGWFALTQIAGLAKAVEDGEKSRQAAKEAEAQKKAAAKHELADARAAEDAERQRRQQAAREEVLARRAKGDPAPNNSELVAAPPPNSPPSIAQPQYYPLQQPQQPVVFVQTAHRPEPRLHSGGWFARSFMSTSGILLAIFVFFGGIVMLTCGGCLYVAYSGAAAVSEVAKQVEAEQKKIEAQNKQQIVNGAGAESQTKSIPTPPDAPSEKPAVKKDAEFASRGSVLRIGNIEAKIQSVSIGKVALKRLGDEGESSKEHLILKISLHNTSTNKRITFRGWPGLVSLGSNVTAKDEHDNGYRVIDFGFASRPIGDATGETIEPNGDVTAVIAFEVPIDAAQSLLITLDGDAVGLEKSALKWKLARTDWAQ